MSGLYIHIPYCKKVCTYCDFHFSASLKNKSQLIDALCDEIKLQKNYIQSGNITTLYFGGGTPSVLSVSEISQILDVLHKEISLNNIVEFTFEVNPDDLNLGYLNDLKSLGVNRLSIGIQSFSDTDLKWMNRRHTSGDALHAVNYAKMAGFSNITIDLIYGLPCSNVNTWQKNLEIFKSLDIPHLSAYHLTIEPKTVLGVWKKRGKFTEIEEDESVRQYEMLLENTEKWGYSNYEISNFCKNDIYSKHNLNYWNQGHYLGLGPSAHSYNGNSRQWNISVNQTYIDRIKNGESYFEKEELSVSDSFNDYILTRLRTKWGINFAEIQTQFGARFLEHIQLEIGKISGQGLLDIDTTHASLTQKGKFIANSVISAFMYVD
jgi:oxygen-independent coproporphyrinogen-3 oxidase